MLVLLVKCILESRNLHRVKRGGLGGFSILCLCVWFMQVRPFRISPFELRLILLLVRQIVRAPTSNLQWTTSPCSSTSSVEASIFGISRCRPPAADVSCARSRAIGSLSGIRTSSRSSIPFNSVRALFSRSALVFATSDPLSSPRSCALCI